ncbi:threonylcarbamoyl-AMP synthase [Candidatus Woesearchaeota archaeon]|nr:threonylcarbamoyl-AMP synthase [Candidatus Woesearchaeota archaeon]
MARIINKDELRHEPKLVLELKNSVFIYPTDTIYGIGCDATNKELVAKVREIKKSAIQPFSIIIPNKNLIYENCKNGEKIREWADKLPGPYTIIMRVKKKFFADNVNPDGDTIGVRIPNNWFYDYVKKMKVPIITTSANITGGDFMTDIENLNPEIKKKVDFIIYDGPIKGRPSTIVNLAKEGVEVKKR